MIRIYGSYIKWVDIFFFSILCLVLGHHIISLRLAFNSLTNKYIHWKLIIWTNSNKKHSDWLHRYVFIEYYIQLKVNTSSHGNFICRLNLIVNLSGFRKSHGRCTIALVVTIFTELHRNGKTYWECGKGPSNHFRLILIHNQ